MRIVCLLLLAALVYPAAGFALETDSKFPLFTTREAAQHHCPFDVVVWLNTKTDVYALADPKPGEDTSNGAYMCQGEADQMNYHAAPSTH